ncbi:MAG: glycosyltransferase family 4 protein [Pseudomonas sp.]|nr:glycosyltransferase family 4 protein [Pseudomonas sp.]
MEKLNWHMADELSSQATVKVIGPSGSALLKPLTITLTEAPLKPLSLFLLVAFLKGLWLALRWKPDVILAGSGLTAPIVWLLSKLCGARSAAYLHGFDITVNHDLYRRFWRPTFKKLDRVIVNSRPTQALAISAGVNQSNMSIVYPGVSLPEAPQPKESVTTFKTKYDLSGKKILLSVGRLTTRKGLREFVEHSLPSIVHAEPNAMLIVIGVPPSNSLGAGIQTVESIQAQAERSGVARHIRFLGVVTDKDLLATAYEAADVHVFPVRNIVDDPEGFGMVAVEAAAHGLPTIAFATGGIVDAVMEGASGYMVETNNYPQMSNKILQCLSSPPADKAIRGFAEAYSWPTFREQLVRALQVDPL